MCRGLTGDKALPLKRQPFISGTSSEAPQSVPSLPPKSIVLSLQLFWKLELGAPMAGVSLTNPIIELLSLIQRASTTESGQMQVSSCSTANEVKFMKTIREQLGYFNFDYLWLRFFPFNLLEEILSSKLQNSCQLLFVERI